jgi:hypothetical protein
MSTAENETNEQKEIQSLLDEKAMLRRLPVSRRTLVDWKSKNIIPFIRIGRRCLYHWPSVEAALLRRQREAEVAA